MAPDPSSTQEQAQGQHHQQQPASPPLPQRHTALTPGPRAAKLQTMLDTTLSHTLGKVSWDNFAACYPTVAARAPATLRAVQTQLVERLSRLCKKEFDSIQESRNVVAKLNELESLISEAANRRDAAARDGGGGVVPPIPPHMLSADEILAAHMAPHLAQQQSHLNARLQTTQAHNARLFEEIRLQRAEMNSLVGLLEKVLEDVDGASNSMDGVTHDIAVETTTIEAEMMNAGTG